jgi:catechol 2,3-dioxygenase-like lactoylglutathione lyase family enzyme
MQFGYTIIYVEDVPATVAFYESAFGLRRRFVHPSGDFGDLDTGATALAFSSLRLMTELGKNPQRANASTPCFEIAFTTTDVQAAVQKALAAGARLVQAPEQMPWGQTVAYVADLNDALVELCTPVAPPATT